jgi:hypothetical protein
METALALLAVESLGMKVAVAVVAIAVIVFAARFVLNMAWRLIKIAVGVVLLLLVASIVVPELLAGL